MSEEMKVLAVIAGENITDEDIDHYIERLSDQQKAYASNPMFRQQVLTQVINTKLLSVYGHEQKLDESEGYIEVMKNIGRDVLAQMVYSTIVDVLQVSDEEAKAYFEVHGDSFIQEEGVAAKHILVESEEKANEIKAEINSGAISFEDAARKYSSCPSNAQGGDLGRFGHGSMVKEFEDVAFAAELNEIAGPVQTQFGYHLIKVYKVFDGSSPAFEDIADQVKATVLQEKKEATFAAKLEELKAKYMK